MSSVDSSQVASSDHVDEAGVESVEGVGSAAGGDGDAGSVARANGRAAFLSDVIVELGFVDATVVENAEQEARELGRSLTQVLLDKRELTDEQLARSIAARNGLDYVDLNGYDVDLGAAELIDASAARRYRAVPIAFDRTGELVLAIADPVDALAVSDIAVITKSKVRTVVAAGSAIDAVIARLPDAAPRPRPTDESLPQDDRLEHEDASRVVPPVGAAPPNVGVIGDARGRPRSEADAATGSNRLQERIMQLVESALDGAADGEVGSLEAELTKEQQTRGILEAELDAERQARDALEAELDAERQARDALEAELEQERESRSTETKALMAEREEYARERDELAQGIREQVAMASQKSTELERLLTELQAATTRDVGSSDPDA